MPSNDSQSIIVGVAMILVLEWVTQIPLCNGPNRSSFTELTKDTSQPEW